MPAPFDVETLGNGASLAAVDSAGNLSVVGALTTGKYLALAAQSAVPVQVPGQALLYTLDGSTISMVAPAGTASLVSAPPTVLTAPVTVTASVAKTPLITGPTIPAGGLTAGMTYRVVAWGTVTTTVDTQTIQFEVDYGTTDVFTLGAQAPNSSATVTGAAWKLEADLTAQSATSITASGWDGLDFFFSSLNQSTTAVTSTTAKALTLQVTNSDVAVSLTINGGYIERIA